MFGTQQPPDVELVYSKHVEDIIIETNEGNKVCNLLVFLAYTGCPIRNVPHFGRVFLILKYTDITQNTYIQS
jgi:transposase